MAGISAAGGAQVPEGGMCGTPAQASDSTRSAAEPWAFGAWLAGGTHEPIKTRMGHEDDRALYLLGINASHSIQHWGFGDLRYTPTLVPGIIATANREYRMFVGPNGTVGYLPYKQAAFGAGLIPFAVEASFHISDRIGIALGGGGGAAYFDRRIPDPGETRFNFLADGHAGVYLRSALGVATLGFGLQHISNGNTGRVNPGLDSRMLYAGFSR
ncbi:MAG: acyloxyacyl hydrolase [Gemmatimonadaceae bacterium]